jgi:hypothetical protein
VYRIDILLKRRYLTIENECKHQITIYDYDGDPDVVCGFWWQKTGQDNKPYYERDRLYCFPEKCSDKCL